MERNVYLSRDCGAGREVYLRRSQDTQFIEVKQLVVDEDMRIRPSVVTVERADDKYFYISDALSEAIEYCATAVDQPLKACRVGVYKSFRRR